MSEDRIKLEDWAQGIPMRAGPVALGLYQPSPETAEYWQGLERRELLPQRRQRSTTEHWK